MAERRRRAAAIGAVMLVAAIVGGVVMLGSGSAKPARKARVVPAGDTTTTVEMRTLAEHAQVDGTLGYGGTLELYDRVAGTFTWLPSVGAVIERGGTLWKVNDLPVVLMYGTLPAYRTLREGVSAGPDVTELNENLVALGFDPYGEIDDYEDFGAATAAAVRRWQKAEGLSETGEVDLGRIVFAPSARRVTTVHVALGQDPPASGSETPSAERRSPNKPDANEDPRESPSESSHSGDPSGSESPKDEPGSPKDEPRSPESEPTGAGMAVLGTTSTSQIVQVQLEADQQQLAHVGQIAPVTLPSGQTVKGRITSVGTVATAPSGGGESGKATIPVRLVLLHRAPRLDQAPVTVELVKERRRNVLAIPAGALVATAGGGYAIEALRAGRRVQIPVTPGMFADGYVQIEGAGVHAGLAVTEPSE